MSFAALRAGVGWDGSNFARVGGFTRGVLGSGDWFWVPAVRQGGTLYVPPLLCWALRGVCRRPEALRLSLRTKTLSWICKGMIPLTSQGAARVVVLARLCWLSYVG